MGVTIHLERPRGQPLFCLESLVWAGKPAGGILEWLLQGSAKTLQCLDFIHCPKRELLCHLLSNYGRNLRSLRLRVVGAIPTRQLGELKLSETCAELEEVMVNDAVGENLLFDLPSSVQHFAFQPSRMMPLWSWDGMEDWIESRKKLKVITLSGHVVAPFRSPVGGFDRNGNSDKTSEIVMAWAEACKKHQIRLDIAKYGSECFWNDGLEEDYRSPIVKNRKYQ
ncbi:hypothetical protein FRB94_005281 [Tulasnella sp. JGI-2019a]|nr:hypothetical protein FRB94_005281 [Tulasnella sp. JGI-2019a]